MKKNKLLLLVTMFAVAFLVLVACGDDNNGDSGTEPNQTETPTDNDTDGGSTSELSGTIRFSWWGDDGRHAATREIIDLFVSENPGVTITPEYGPWDGFQETFVLNLDSGNEADLMQVNFNWLELYSPFGDTFLDLSTVSNLELGNWSSDELDIVTINGAVQAAPSGITARVPFMRTDIYAAAGLDVQDINTWDDLMEAGRTIQAELGEDYFALSPLGNPSLAYMVFSWLEQYTGRQFVDENNQFSYTLEELTAGFQLVQDMLDNGVLATHSADAINSTNPRWISGHYGGVSEWDSSINNWINNLDVEDGEAVIEVRNHFTMETAADGNPPVLSGVMARPSMAFAISRNSQYPEVAAAFLNFMLTDERAVAILGTDRGVPANSVGLGHFNALVAAGEIGGAAIDANNIHANADRTTMSPVFEFQEVRDVYEPVLGNLQAGYTTVEEAAQFVYDNIQSVIDSLVVD